MNQFKEFEILIRTKVPFLSGLLFNLLGVCCLFLFLFYIIMIPTRNSSEEMATAYFILVVPQWLATLSAYAGIGLLILAPLYYKLRLHVPAVLSFRSDEIKISGKKILISMPYLNIKKIFCNDLKNSAGRSKNQLQIVISGRGIRPTTFRLKDYGQAEEFIELISTVENAKFSFYDDDAVGSHDDE
jgi:hypothetical protein